MNDGDDTLVIGGDRLHCMPTTKDMGAAWDRPRITAFEWACQWCGESGLGLMPEKHASEYCARLETTRVRPPYRMVPEIARETQYMVADILKGTTHFMDGGGI